MRRGPRAPPTRCPALPGDPVDRTTTTPSRARRAGIQPPGVRAVPRAAHAAIFPPRGSTATAASRSRPGQVLARFDDGTPALMEARTGPGRAGCCCGPPRWTWNGTICPSNRCSCRSSTRVTKYLADFTEAPASLTVGQVIPAPRKAPGKGAAVDARRDDRRGPLRRPRLGRDRGRRARTDRAGFLRRPHAGRRRRFGDDAREQRRSRANRIWRRSIRGSWRRRSPAARPGELGGLGNGRPSDEAQAQAQRLWWYLLVAGGLLLAAETLLSNRLSQNGARVS